VWLGVTTTPCLCGPSRDPPPAAALQIPSIWWIDPAAAAAIAIFIIYSWAETGKEQVDMLAGRAASPEFLRKVTYLVYNHDEAILKVDTVRAYHFGVNFLVEVGITLKITPKTPP